MLIQLIPSSSSSCTVRMPLPTRALWVYIYIYHMSKHRCLRAMSRPLQRASPPSAAPAVEENNSSQKTKGKSRLSKKEINRQGYAARCNQKNLPNAASSIALEDKYSWMLHFVCKQADQGKTVSASVEKANGEKISITIGHGGGSGPRGRGIPQAGNVFSSSPPMRGVLSVIE